MWCVHVPVEYMCFNASGCLDIPYLQNKAGRDAEYILDEHVYQIFLLYI